MRQVETERKFDIGAEHPLPALGGVVGVGATGEHRMRAVYLDTTDLLLVRHGITLRRREGGPDEGWHLKLPNADGSRTEVQAPLTEGPGRFRVPEDLHAEITRTFGHAWPEGADAALVPAAVLNTSRLEAELTDDSRVVALLADDTVTALPQGHTWRELEVELVDGDEELLGRITTTFQEQGVELSDSPSKLARALGDRPERVEAGQRLSEDDRAADVLLSYLTQQVAVIVGREEDVRADVPDAVHKTRVATRRLRSALRTFRRLLDRDVTDPLRDEVKWFATVLGEPRDAEVMKERILTALDELPDDQIVGPVRDRVREELDARHAAAHATLVEVLDSDRYGDLVDRLMELVAEPPWRGKAREPAATVLPKLVRKAVDRAQAEWDAASARHGEERLHLLHEARKRAKAVRYACEAVAPAFGSDAATAAKAWEKVTERLGEVQDAAVGIDWLTELGEEAEQAGEPTFTYGVLVGQEDMALQGASLTQGEEALQEALARKGFPRS